MKFLIVFAMALSLALATVSAKDLYARSIEVPVFENEGRITNGQMAIPGQFKYQVGLILTEANNLRRLCGGSLIDKNWILTAGHCSYGALSIEVHLGVTKLYNPEKTFFISKPDDIFIHPNFDLRTLNNDISLIRIPTAPQSSRIGTIKIPSDNNNKYVGNRVIATGWGRNGDSGTGVIDLKYGIVSISPGSVCAAFYASQLYSDATNICVATPNKVSNCDGDSGGPLVLAGEELQVGVFSFDVENACTKGFPIGFTRVSAYLPWISSHTKIVF